MGWLFFDIFLRWGAFEGWGEFFLSVGEIFFGEELGRGGVIVSLEVRFVRYVGSEVIRG